MRSILRIAASATDQGLSAKRVFLPANLKLESTSNATKGAVLIQPNGGNIGIGTTSAGYPLDIYGSQNTAQGVTTAITNQQSRPAQMYFSSGASLNILFFGARCLQCHLCGLGRTELRLYRLCMQRNLLDQTRRRNSLRLVEKFNHGPNRAFKAKLEQRMDDESLKNDIRGYLHLTCNMLVNDGDSVSVDYVSGERTTVFQIRASNIGAILGKKGRLIKAMRDIVISAAHKHRIRCVIEIVENPDELKIAG